MRNYLFTIILSIITFVTCYGQLTVAKIFSDNMMLQADAEIPIWGQANPNSTIEIQLNELQLKGVVNDEGRWKIMLPSKALGSTASITITCENEKITISNIIYGDIWLCGGQSNMEWFVQKSDNADEEISTANFSNLRIFDVPRMLETRPALDLPSGEWEECSPESIPQFSAVGYFFGRHLLKELERPIGLIGNNYGGTIVEAWTSSDGLKGISTYEEKITKLHSMDIDEVKRQGEQEDKKWMSSFSSQDKGMVDSTYQWAETNTDSWKTMKLPGLWESSPDTSLHEKDGVVWFSRSFELEQISNAELSLGAIDDSDITWVNGHKVGETFNQFNKDRSYQIDQSKLKKGSNTITIRVEDYMGGGGLYGKPEKLFIKTKDQFIPLAGDWNYEKGMIVTTPMPTRSFSPNNYPTSLYNGMIAPITDFPIKGVIWYQGESNSYRAYEYRTVFPRLIQDWRKQWKQENLPFIFVQLANFNEEQATPKESEWAELREAQSMALALNNTAMVTAIDLGEKNDIHPTNKQDVGLRLANAALSEVYQKQVTYKGPSYKDQVIEGSSIIVSFDDVGKGLMVEDKFGFVSGFTIAGEDKIYQWAKAEIISKNQVRVWSNKVLSPVTLRYAWQNNPNPANLKNSHSLPAFPFRTDNYPISTFEINRF